MMHLLPHAWQSHVPFSTSFKGIAHGTHLRCALRRLLLSDSPQIWTIQRSGHPYRSTPHVGNCLWLKADLHWFVCGESLFHWHKKIEHLLINQNVYIIVMSASDIRLSAPYCKLYTGILFVVHWRINVAVKSQKNGKQVLVSIKKRPSYFQNKTS